MEEIQEDFWMQIDIFFKYFSIDTDKTRTRVKSRRRKKLPVRMVHNEAADRRHIHVHQGFHFLSKEGSSEATKIMYKGDSRVV